MPREYTDVEVEEIILQLKNLKKQLNEIEAKIDSIISSQALIIGVLNGTIDITPFQQQQDAAKMH